MMQIHVHHVPKRVVASSASIPDAPWLAMTFVTHVPNHVHGVVIVDQTSDATSIAPRLVFVYHATGDVHEI